MAKYDLSKIMEISQKAEQVIPLDLGQFLGEHMKGCIMPFKAKTYEETLKLKNKYELQMGTATTKFIEFSKADKRLRDFYEKDIPTERKNATRFIVICDAVTDKVTLSVGEFKQRLHDVLLNVDMDSVSVSGKTLWEDLGLERGDYVGLVEKWSPVIQYEEELITLEAIVQAIKSGLRDEIQISIRVAIQGDLRRIMAIKDEDTRNTAYKEYQDNFLKVQKNLMKTAKRMGKNIKEQQEVIENESAVEENQQAE